MRLRTPEAGFFGAFGFGVVFLSHAVSLQRGGGRSVPLALVF
jgi:hypothetical protein